VGIDRQRKGWVARAHSRDTEGRVLNVRSRKSSWWRAKGDTGDSISPPILTHGSEEKEGQGEEAGESLCRGGNGRIALARIVDKKRPKNQGVCDHFRLKITSRKRMEPGGGWRRTRKAGGNNCR